MAHFRGLAGMGPLRTTRLSLLGCVLAAGLPIAPSLAQTCPAGPVSVNGTACAETPGSTINVTSAAIPGLNATNPGGRITADGITVNLGPGALPRNYIGAQVSTGGIISLSGSTIATVQADSSQRGVTVVGPGSQITGTGTAITLGTSAATVSSSIGILVQAGGLASFTNSSVATLSATNGIGNHALRATGANSQIAFTGGSIGTQGRGSFGAFADGGATITLSGGTAITVSGTEIIAGSIGNRGLVSSGADSLITATGITVNANNRFGNAVWAENGGEIDIIGGALNTSGIGSLAAPSAAIAVSSGSTVRLSGGTSVTTSGQNGYGLWVNGVGSQAFVANSAFQTSGLTASGLFITAGGFAEISGTSFLTSRGVAGVVEQASTLTMTGGSIASVGSTNAAFALSGGSTASLTGTAISTGGDSLIVNGGLNSSAVQVTGGAAFTGTNLTITTNGNGRAYGVISGVGGVVNLVGGSVDTFGTATDPATSNARRPEALVAQGANAFLQAAGMSLHTRGNEGFAVVADDGGTVLLDGVTVVTDGLRGIGLYAVTDQAVVGSNTVTGNGVSVSTAGQFAHGALAAQGNLAPLATVNLSGSAIATTGLGAAGLRASGMGTVNAGTTAVGTTGTSAHGMVARDNGSSVNVASTNVTAQGTFAHGALAERGGLLNGVASTVTATGSGAAALYVAGEPGFVSTANFTGSTLTNIVGPTVGVAGSGNVTLTNSVAGGSGQWLSVGTVADFPPLLTPEPLLSDRTDAEIGVGAPAALPTPPALGASPGLANIDLLSSTVTGSAITQPGSVSNVRMIGNSLWNLTGSSNLTFLFNDPSLIDFSAPVGDPRLLASYKTLTVNNYVGEGGQIAFNTYLDTDGSPSDLLVIDGGTATGTTGVIIKNTTGLGALTNSNGILVVDAIAGATTTPSAFALARPAVAGPYEYSLYRASLDASGPENWYLRSELVPDPEPDPDPHFRQEVSLAAAIPTLGLFYGRSLLDTLHERIGERVPRAREVVDPIPETVRLKDEIEAPVAPEVAAKENYGQWGRIIGVHGRHQGDPIGIYGAGPSFDYGLAALQAGIDLYYVQDVDDDGSVTTDTAGVYGAVGTASADVEHHLLGLGDFPGGATSLNAFSLGGYWTRYGPEGWYLDGVVQGTLYDFSIDSRRGLDPASTGGFGLAASLEAGYPLSLGEGWILEPQAQAIFQSIAIDDFNDGAADISFSGATSLVGRIGVRLARTFLPEGGEQGRDETTLWGRVNLYHEFLGQPTTSFSSATGPMPFTADLSETWIQFGLGADIRLDDKSVIFGQASYDTTLDGKSHAFEGKLGLKVQW